MNKRFLMGAGIAFVILAGAGCGKAAPSAQIDSEKTVIPSTAIVKTDAQATSTDPKAETDVPTKSETVPGTKIEGAPVEVSILGLNESKRGLRVSIKVTSPKNLKKVFMAYSCVDEAGNDSDKAIDNWENPGDDGAARPIVSGQTYETELYLYNEAARCVELRPTRAIFEDGSEWEEPGKF